MKENAVGGYGESIVARATGTTGTTGTAGVAGEGSYKYEEGIFDAYKYDIDSEKNDAITTYPYLQLESRRIFYSKFFNLMKSSYRY
jgi:hypothetical protein